MTKHSFPPAISFTYLTSSTSDGNLSFPYGKQSDVVQNREAFLTQHNFSLDDCAVMQVLDETVIHQVTTKDKGKGARQFADVIMADALVTTEKGVLLFLLTADCLPATFYDPVHQVLALAHLGRKSSTKHLATKMVEFLGQNYQSQPQDLIVILGPAIQQESYILDQQFVQLDKDWQPFVKHVSATEVAINLAGFNHNLLQQSGVKSENIVLSSIDTAKSNQFFSHYRAVRQGETEGRFATVVGL
jgi:polyphenol oxidase